MKRRQFLKSAAFTGAGALILPRVRLFGADAPSNKLNIGLIGTWGRGEAHFNALASENVVALCDVSEEHLANSSGHAALDAFALDVLRRAVPLTQIPSALHNSVFEVAVVMVFALPQNWNHAGNPLPSSAHQRVTHLQNE